MTITVFLADDHAVVREGLWLLIDAQPDITVIGDAADGRVAVDRIIELSPDIALVDIAMPELNGIEVARRVQETCPGTRVIILSMYSSTEHIYHALQAGAGGFLLKESAGAEVINAIRAVFAGRRYLSQKITDRVINGFINQYEVVEADSPLASLSTREREILQLVVEGFSSAQIAERLVLSPKTVETYRSRLMQKLGVSDLPGLVKFAIQHGLTTLD